MILIIEGMDRCGKTTLIKNLRKEFFTSPRTLVHHSSSPPKVEFPNDWEKSHYDELFCIAKTLVINEKYDVIFDRFHLGAIVYGQKYRGMNPKSIYKIDRMHLSTYANAALILLTDDVKGIIERDDGDSLEQNEEDYEDTLVKFKDAFDRSTCMNKIHINVSQNGGVHNTLPTVIDFLRGLK